jgi:hypothetical protein
LGELGLKKRHMIQHGIYHKEYAYFVQRERKSQPVMSKIYGLVMGDCSYKLNFVYICITRGKNTTFGSKMVLFPARNANIYKICELHRAIFSSFYNNSQPNFAILLIVKAHSTEKNFPQKENFVKCDWPT